jgi:hypothetical protein
MKALLKIALFTLALILLLGIKGAKASEEFTRIIRKEFNINPDAALVINNKFGKVHCNNWDKNSVSFEVTIMVTAANQKEADKLFQRIAVQFQDTPARVEARTIIEEGRSPGTGKFNVDMIVNMPATVNLDLTNKFGDVFINEVNGKARVDVSYGNLEANKLGNSDNFLEIKFSKARVNWMKGAVVNLKYSEMSITYAGSLRLDSKFSNLDADKIIALNVSFEGGTLNMENSSAVDSKSKFSDLDIGRIEQSLNLDIQYGSCKVREMPEGFTSVSIKNKYANVDVRLGKSARYNLDAHLKFCSLDFPDEKAKFSYRSKTNTENTFRGTIGGQDPIPTSNVTVKSEFGNVSLQ